MALVNFMEELHTSTKRDYTERVCKHDKSVLVEKAMQYGKDYWDGDRTTGYGGYRYMPGRWKAVAERLIHHYGLGPAMRVLDVGCGKAFQLYELSLLLPQVELAGIDSSHYAIDHAKEEMKPFIRLGDATKLPFPDKHFDLVISLGTLHNLTNFALFDALKEIERVGRGGKYLMQESYRTEREKTNMLNWQLTQRTFFRVDEWEWFFKLAGYTGDYEFIVFA